MNAEFRSGLNDLTALDWIGGLLAVLGALFSLQIPFLTGPAFERMFADFGGTHLPRITLLALTPWFPILIGLVPLGALGLAALSPLSLGARRALIVAAFALSLAGAGMLLYALYAPIFEVSSAIQA